MKQKFIEKECLYCKQTFTALFKEHARGNAKYCNRVCFGKAKSEQLVADYSKINLPNCVCTYCNKEFYRNTYRKSKSRSSLYFCSRICKDHGQRIENGNKTMWPDHFNTGTRSYRVVALRTYAHVCMVCGYDKQPEILEVHHKDHNRANNATDNLEVLCPNCHSEHHFAFKTGKWTPQKDNSVAA